MSFIFDNIIIIVIIIIIRKLLMSKLNVGNEIRALHTSAVSLV